MVFSHARKFLPLNLKLQNDDIDFVTSFKFLGVVLEKQLTWSPYIKKLSEKNVKGI